MQSHVENEKAKIDYYTNKQIKYFEELNDNII